MADFVSPSWSLFVAAVTVLGLLACLVLLLVASRRKVMATDNTTGHVWDEDLRELNNPLPRWWMGLFVLTVVFAAIYLTLYPGLGAHQGSLQWSSQAQFEQEQKKAQDALVQTYTRFVSMDAAALAADPQARAIGERLFVNNCAACHGSDARGSKGFPNLTDSDWLHGGSLEQIKETVTKGRIGNMPPMAAAVGTAEDARNLAHYVMSLSGSPHNSLAAQAGKAKFGACAGCHGADGRGNTTLGAPNLTDKVWLHGWGEQAIVNIIQKGKVNAMPAQDKLLTADQIHVLAGYVWGLSNTPLKVTAR
ncbi:MAG: cytochrome-c oxidase, cbb3-type subunit III [Burkholderiaceae bacterium]|jgi:cytochrome c oxidase cbb3-type subunit III